MQIVVVIVFVAVISASPPGLSPKTSASETQDKSLQDNGTVDKVTTSVDANDQSNQDEVLPVNQGTITPVVNSTTEEHCSALLATMKTSGIPQTCTVHQDCRGACCSTNLLAHNITYNFTVTPCDPPSVLLDFRIVDIEGAQVNETIKSSLKLEIPNGNMSYQGMFETASSVEVVLEKVLDITHFRLDFGVHYKVLASDPLKQLFSHTLVPMLSVDYSKELCVKPTVPPKTVVEVSEETNGNEDKYFGVIPKEYVKDKKTLALISTSVTLAVIILIVSVYCIISKKRRSDNFYRTYISTDENRHLTKGNDGFEPLDDSDID